MQIKNILVAVDASENSDRALDFALGLAEKYNASLLIVNVFDAQAISPFATANPEITNSLSIRNTPDFTRDIRKIHEEILAKKVERAKAASTELKISSLAIDGEPAVQIANTAKEGGFDLIVVGHGGASRMSEFFLGSVSERVAHLAPCSVIIVK